MKLNKKGFTLVELLAVIVVLGIIALIGYTVIGDVITNAQLGADARSFENYIGAIESKCLEMKALGSTPIASDIISNVNESFKGTKPSSATEFYNYITFDISGCKVTASNNIGYGNSTCTYDAGTGRASCE